MECAALVGCAVTTGVGAVLNTAKVEPGSIVAVIGAGGVGLNVIQGAALAGARAIVAIDTADEKLEFAKIFGATHVDPQAATETPVDRVRKTVGAPDYAFECIGLPETIAAGVRDAAQGRHGRRRGHRARLAKGRAPGVPPSGHGEDLTGSMYGSTRPRVDFPKFIDALQGEAAQARRARDRSVTGSKTPHARSTT